MFISWVGGWRMEVSLRTALDYLPYPVGCVARSCLRLFAQVIIIIIASVARLFSLRAQNRTSLLLTRLISAEMRIFFCSSSCSTYSRFRTLLKVYQVITEHWSDRNGCCCARFTSDRFVLYEIRNWILKSLLPILK